MDDREPNHQDHELIPDAKAEVTGMLKGGMAHPSTKPVLTGAGAGFMLYKRIRP